MMRLNVLLVAALAAWIGLLSATVAAGKGFRTPEDAVTAYLNGVAARDFEQILAATAVDEMSSNFDFVAYVERLAALMPSAPAPSDDPMFVALNEAAFTAQISNQVRFLTYGLMSTSSILQGEAERMDGAGATAFANAVDPSRLEGLTISRIEMPEAALVNNELYKTNVARQAQIYGADEQVERVALVTFEGANYVVGFTLLRYGDSWGISSQYSPISGLSVNGVPQPTTPGDFEGMLR